MGSYTCKICPKGKTVGTRANTASREMFLEFANGHKYIMPESILHYVDHGWCPPPHFVHDIVHEPLTTRTTDMQYVNRGAETFHEKFGLERIGYLGDIVPNEEVGFVSPEFCEKLFYYLTSKEKLTGRGFLASMGA